MRVVSPPLDERVIRTYSAGMTTAESDSADPTTKHRERLSGQDVMVQFFKDGVLLPDLDLIKSCCVTFTPKPELAITCHQDSPAWLDFIREMLSGPPGYTAHVVARFPSGETRWLSLTGLTSARISVDGRKDLAENTLVIAAELCEFA